MQTLTVITSAYNEEDCLEELYARLTKIIEVETAYKWRIIICDNASEDNTWTIIKKLASEDDRVFGIRMSRNFKLDAALTCGLDYCDSDAVIVMCSDLQDPPELIPAFLREYELGFDQVLAKVTNRKYLGFTRRLLSRVFYRMIFVATNGVVPENVSDFRLMSKRAYVAARQLREKKRFLRGIMSWSGFTSTEVLFERPARHGGESKFGSRRLVSIVFEALDSIYAHSTIPIAALSALGIFFSVISLSVFILVVFLALFHGVPFAGFGTLISVMLLGFSSLLIAAGVIGSYVGLIYEEVKGRPIYVVQETTT
jgi:dolichol-phosphate mannosyltransferase